MAGGSGRIVQIEQSGNGFGNIAQSNARLGPLGFLW